MLVTLYIPICEHEKGGCFIVNGSIQRDRDEAVRLAKNHVAFRDGKATVIRIDEKQVWDDE